MNRPPPGRRADVLAVLRTSPLPLSITDIAERLGVHPNTVRFHLDTLAGTGQVERVQAAPAGPGRPALLFRIRPGMDPTGPRNYRLLAGILAGSVATDPAALGRATEAGRAWGRQLAESAARSAGSPAGPAEPSAGSSADVEDQAVDRLVELLGELGFAPERRSTGDVRQIGLRHCPFLDLVHTQAQVICQVHLALMQGALTGTGASATVERLEPFAEPDLCLAHLGTAGGTS
ncbi:helix-turn-helix domain-containing protein [Plantactinospora sp. B6F1]|uniref:helix-turn-helix transcriptional regulator n=1 Tax=Plantactinospora sp. B6F1 TaxID=3158971 RepID=UPI0032D9A495